MNNRFKLIKDREIIYDKWSDVELRSLEEMCDVLNRLQSSNSDLLKIKEVKEEEYSRLWETMLNIVNNSDPELCRGILMTLKSILEILVEYDIIELKPAHPYLTTQMIYLKFKTQRNEDVKVAVISSNETYRFIENIMKRHHKGW